MTIEQAASHVLISGDYRGQKIGEVAVTNEGLLDLALLSCKCDLYPLDREPLDFFLCHNDIHLRLDRIRKDRLYCGR